MVDFQPVTLNKTMLFLLAKADSIRPVEAYLRKREWDIVVTSNLKEAIINVIQMKPSYFFISYDFPNKKALALGRALEHQTSVIITGEVAKPHTLKAIQDLNVRYKLPPPVTGPAIERLLNRITRDLQNQDAEIQENIKRGTVTKEQENIIKIRSSFMKSGDGDSMIHAGGGIGALLSSMSEDSGPVYSQAAFDASDGGAYSAGGSHSDEDLMGGMSKAAAMFEKAAAEHGAKDDEVPDELPLSELAKLTPEEFAKAMERLKKKSQAQAQKPQADANNSGSQSPSDAASKGQGPQSGEGDDFDEALADQVQKDFERLKRMAIARRQRKYQGAEYGNKNDPAARLRERKEKSGAGERITLLEAGTREAVDKTVLHQSDGDEAVELKNSTRVACIFVESERFRGYLLVAFPEDRSVDMDLIEQMKLKLFSFLKENGEKATDAASMSLKMTEVAFEDWAVEQAEFLKSTMHKGQELAVAFFPDNTRFAELQEQTKLKKYELSIDELRGDLVVEFDLYLHLEKNDKLLLYTPQGKPFYANQKDRLKTKGISNLYINQDSANDLKKYRVQNYLNDKIAEFKNKKKES